MKSAHCRHIKTNGKRCMSPALRSKDLCYFHARVFQRQYDSFGPPFNPADLALPACPSPAPPIEFDLPILEDAESIQISLSLIVAALGRNRIDIKRANALIYGLRTASFNARRIITEPLPETVTCNVVPSDFDTDLAAPEPLDADSDLTEAPAPMPHEPQIHSSIHSNFAPAGDVIKEGVQEVK